MYINFVKFLTDCLKNYTIDWYIENTKKMKGLKNMKKLGFTLAEVLITLVIIGVIAAMTIPTLMNNTNANEYRSALKKAMSSVNQALETEYALEGLTAADFDSDQELVDGVFKKRLQTIENTTQPDVEGVSGSSFTTADGAIFTVTGFSGGSDSNEEGSACDYENTAPCGDEPNLYIDVNGLRKPNRHTTNSNRPRDIYQATIYSQKIIAYGDATQGVMFDKPSKEDAD